MRAIETDGRSTGRTLTGSGALATPEADASTARSSCDGPPISFAPAGLAQERCPQVTVGRPGQSGHHALHGSGASGRPYLDLGILVERVGDVIAEASAAAGYLVAVGIGIALTHS